MAPPINDDVANATDVLVGVLKETVAGTTIDSTIEAAYEGDPLNIGSGQSVWYHFSPDEDARFAYDLTKTSGGDAGWFPYGDLWRCSTYPPTDANDLVYENTFVGNGTATPPYAHKINVTAGEHYLIQVTDWDYDGSTEGNFDLRVQLVPSYLYESWEDGTIDPIVWERRIVSASPAADPNGGVWAVDTTDPALGTYSILLTPTTQLQQLTHHDSVGGGQNDRDYWVAFKFMVDWAEMWASDTQTGFLPGLTAGNQTTWPHTGSNLVADAFTFLSLFALSSSTGEWQALDGTIVSLSGNTYHELRTRYRRQSSNTHVIVDQILDGTTIVSNYDTGSLGATITGIAWRSTLNAQTSGSVRVDPLVWSPDTDPGPLVAANEISAPFISEETLFTPQISGQIEVPFISAGTTVFTPTLTGDQDLVVPFIGPATSVYAPTIVAANRVRVSQIPVEVVVSPTDADVRVSQVPVEAVVAPTDAAARVSQIPVEAVVANVLETVNVVWIDWHIDG